MPINIAGSWEVSVSFYNPFALAQRFVISGADSGNGIYIGTNATPPINVTGNNWVVNMQACDDYDAKEDPTNLRFRWLNSTIERTPTRNENGYLVFELNAEDFVLDGSVDLQLTFKIPGNTSTGTGPAPVAIPETPILVAPPTIVPPTPPQAYIPPQPPTPTNLGVGKVFTKFDVSDKLPKQKIKTTHGIWLDTSGDPTGNLLTFFTSSTEYSSSYRRTVYQKEYDSCEAEPHFTIAYGHADGSGSRDLGGNDFYTPTKAVYGQYRLLCLPPSQRRFTIGSKTINHFYAINVARQRMGDKLDEGNLEINLHHLSGSEFLTGNGNRNAHTGSNVRLGSAGNVLRLIDDWTLDYNVDLASDAEFYQVLTSDKSKFAGDGGNYQYIVSGTLETGVYNRTNPQVYGLSYPSLGIIILDADLLDMSASFLSVTGSDVAGDNAVKLFTSLSGSALYTDASGDYLGFQSRKVKYSYVEQFFVRIKNQEYNFSNNPTFVTGSEGQIIDDFYVKPSVYFSEIGLYNDEKELLAIAKPSIPIYKDFTEEALIEVILSYE